MSGGFQLLKKKHYAPLQAYLRQNDLDLEEEDEEEEEEEEKFEVNKEEGRSSGSCYVELSLLNLKSKSSL